MSRKVTVIGAGSVGSSVAFAMTLQGAASEIVMIDVNEEKALGEAMDIRQGTPFCPPIKIYAGSYEDAKDSDIVIITSGVPRKPGQSRLDLTQTNIDMIKEVAPNIVKYAPNSLYIIVSNPVDILTYVFIKLTGLPEYRVIGSGTILDTARLRTRLAEYFYLSQKNIHAYVLGEHGDTSFIPWSVAHVGGVPLEDYKSRFNYAKMTRQDLDKDKVYEHTRTSGAQIIKRKGATYYAIAISACHIVNCLFTSVNSVSTISSMIFGEYGIDDVCLSLPFIIGMDGVNGHTLLPLTEDEIEKLHKSAETVKGVIKQVKI